MDRQQKFKLESKSRVNAKDKASHMIKLPEKETTSMRQVPTGCSLAFKEKRILSIAPQNFALWEFEVFKLTGTHFLTKSPHCRFTQPKCVCLASPGRLEV